MVIEVYRLCLSAKKLYINLITAKDEQLTKAVCVLTPIAILLLWFLPISDTFVAWLVVNVGLLTKWNPKVVIDLV